MFLIWISFKIDIKGEDIMSFEKIFEDINFNFQVNRVLSFGDVACDREEIYKAATKIYDFYMVYRMAEYCRDC